MNFTGLKSKIIAGAAVPLILMFILGLVSISSIKSINQTNGWVEHTYEVLGETLKNPEIGSPIPMK